jgi:alanyl-tRNA synthetase
MTESGFLGSSVIRQQFLDFFATKGHEIVPSASLAPADDPSLLFTNAGMNQFKDIFLGFRDPQSRRVADSQKVMRVSGKHNDLEDVGRSPYHHTFFEMLGNWSFGDYYKRETIAWAWELLTRVWRLPIDKLWATVLEDDKGGLGLDVEAADIWRTQTDILPDHILPFGRKDNFWEMGDTGPCGPCSEIHLDLGPSACNKAGKHGHVCRVNGDCQRFIELWNLVFIQYDRLSDKSLMPLSAKHVDTGMGFERIVGVLQGVKSNYDTDLFVPLIRRTQQLLGASDRQRDEHIVSYQVIADHVRALTFLIGDGVLPANEGRGYVLRLILRRAARHGRMLGFDRPFLHEVAQTVIEIMGAHYGELSQREDFILMTIQQEESRFSQTLVNGLALLDEIVADLEERGETTIPGADVFRLYDTHGFPLDLTQVVAREHNMVVDERGYKIAMEEQRERARAGAQFGAASSADAQVYLDVLHSLKENDFVPSSGVRHVYSGELELKSVLAALVKDGKSVPNAQPGDRVEVVLPETPFYLESGGQLSDTGTITASVDIDGKPAWTIQVDEIRRPVPGLIVHLGRVIDGCAEAGREALARVDVQRRMDITRNHTATHLLDHQLRWILGKHVQQAGSIVAPDRLRFDFTHPNALSQEQLDEIERSVNAAILADQPVRAEQSSYRQAVADGAIALFTEKYGEEVRVIKIGPPGSEFSLELCGGTHVHRTGQIGVFLILSEESVGAGVRRIEAVTGRAAQELIRRRLHLLDRAASLLHVPADAVGEALQTLGAELQAAHKENVRLRMELALQEAGDLARGATRIGDVAVVAAEVGNADAQTLRDMSDRLREMLGSSVVVLATVVDGKPQMIAAVTEDLVQRGLHAGVLVKAIAKIVGGGGGGKAALAQAGGRDPERLTEALAAVTGLVAGQLAGS